MEYTAQYAGLASGGTGGGRGGYWGMGWGTGGYWDWWYTSTGSLMFHSTEEWMVEGSNCWLSLLLLTPRDDFRVHPTIIPPSLLASYHSGNWNNRLRRVFLSWHQDRKCTLNRSLARCETWSGQWKSSIRVSFRPCQLFKTNLKGFFSLNWGFYSCLCLAFMLLLHFSFLPQSILRVLLESILSTWPPGHGTHSYLPGTVVPALVGVTTQSPSPHSHTHHQTQPLADLSHTNHWLSSCGQDTGVSYPVQRNHTSWQGSHTSPLLHHLPAQLVLTD